MAAGVVTAVFSERVRVHTAPSEDLEALQNRRCGTAVVGDRVEVEAVSSAEGEQELWRIARIEPRRRCLWRSSRRREQQLIAAHVDRLGVMSAARPLPRPGLIDRYLLAAEAQQIPVTLLFNKADLDDEELFETHLGLYRDLGYPLLRVSALTGEGLEEVARMLEQGMTVLVGHSGVGKSTLLNRLIPDAELRIGRLSPTTGRGRHTTTVITAHPFGEGWLVDTPGIREFGLVEITPDRVVEGFREFGERARGCRFRDCTHRQEPGCEVVAAVEEGAIDPRRYASYLRIRNSLEAGER